MASKKTLTGMFENLPWIAKILILVFAGWLVCGLYRIVRYTETKNTLTLVVGLLGLFTGVGNFVLEVADVITTVLKNKITFFAD